MTSHPLQPLRRQPVRRQPVRRQPVRRHGPRAVVRAAVLAVLAGALAATTLTGCTSAASGGSTGYIEGSGTITQVPPAKRSAPREFTGTTLKGQAFDLADTRGKVVVINVWASWCPPCRAEAPSLAKVAKATTGQDVVFVGIDTRDEKPQALAFEKTFSMPYPSVTDDGGQILLAFRDTLPPVSIPSTLVLDRQGRVAVRWLGSVTASTLKDLVHGVVAEGTHA